MSPPPPVAAKRASSASHDATLALLRGFEERLQKRKMTKACSPKMQSNKVEAARELWKIKEEKLRHGQVAPSSALVAAPPGAPGTTLLGSEKAGEACKGPLKGCCNAGALQEQAH